MEVKVFVDGVPRVVSGVTEKTSCQEVVIALAQALGQPGRYTLKEKFKDFERCMSANESLLESLDKYGEHVKEVQLTLFLRDKIPLLCESAPNSSRTTDLRDPLEPLLRRKPKPGSRMQKGSDPLISSAQRQSLPVLSQLRQEEEEEGPLEEVTRPKRKSLTLMGAWGWLGSFGRGWHQYSVSEEENKKIGKKSNRNLPEGSVGSGSVGSGSVSSKDWGQDGFLSRVRRRKRDRQCREQRTSCCIGSQKREDNGQRFRKSSLGAKEEALLTKDQTLGSKELGWPNRGDNLEDEKNKLIERIRSQGTLLQDLHHQISSVDGQIGELEGLQTARQATLDAQRKAAEEEETEQLFWESELKAAMGYETDVQARFLEMRESAWRCKAELEEYRQKLQGLDFTTGAETLVQETVKEEDPGIRGKGVTKICTGVETSDATGSVNTGRKETPSESHATVPPDQIKERRLTGPTELREWWNRWSEAHTATTAPKHFLHRSELTVHLGYVV